MTPEETARIHACLDDQLTPEQYAELSRWISDSPVNAETFAGWAMLHDRLRNEFLLPDRSSAELLPGSASDVLTLVKTEDPALSRMHRPRSLATMVLSLVAACAALVVVWGNFSGSQATAASTELRRLIAANSTDTDRTFQIDVETVAQRMPSRRESGPEQSRPPKAPMDGAMLFVRGSGQFVLQRLDRDGPVVTGCNGRESWAVRASGSVRSSTDVTRFSRDLPGHEHQLSLASIQEALERLREAYDVQLLPVEDHEDSVQNTRLLVAVRHRKEKGPRRVEISYEVQSGLIQQIRFVEMPYGPETLTLRLTLQSEEPLGADFFDHQSHHAADRRVERE